MKCPVCASEVKPSKKYPGKYLCDNCKKRFPKSALISDEPVTEESEQEETDVYEIPDDNSLDGDDDILFLENDLLDSDETSSEPDVKPKKKKKWLIVLLVLLILILLAAGAFAAAYFLFPEKADPFLEKIGIDLFQEDAAKPDETLNNTIYSVNETAEYNDISVSVLGYEESEGDEWSAPAEGGIFAFVNMEITNHTEEEIVVNSMASFEAYCGDTKLDYSANAFTALATKSDKQKMDGTIAPGETLSGYLSLEVPADWSTIEIQYADKIWSENKIRFEITK